MSVIAILLSFLLTAFFQPSLVDSLRQKAAYECVKVDYEFESTVSGVRAVGNGTVEIQGNSYHMSGNGIEIYCDGSSTWLVDEVSREVVIEAADSKDAGYLANPLMLLLNIENTASSYRVDGNVIHLELSDGTVLEIEIRDMLQLEKKKPEAFRPPAEFTSDWIITDLR